MSLSRMTVTQLRAALEAEGLDTSGLKPALVQRYEDALSAKASASAAASKASIESSEVPTKRQRTRKTFEAIAVKQQLPVVEKRATRKTALVEPVAEVATRKRKAATVEDKAEVPMKPTTRKKVVVTEPEIPEPKAEVSKKSTRKTLASVEAPAVAKPTRSKSSLVVAEPRTTRRKAEPPAQAQSPAPAKKRGRPKKVEEPVEAVLPLTPQSDKKKSSGRTATPQSGAKKSSPAKPLATPASSVGALTASSSTKKAKAVTPATITISTRRTPTSIYTHKAASPPIGSAKKSPVKNLTSTLTQRTPPSTRSVSTNSKETPPGSLSRTISTRRTAITPLVSLVSTPKSVKSVKKSTPAKAVTPIPLPTSATPKPTPTKELSAVSEPKLKRRKSMSTYAAQMDESTPIAKKLAPSPASSSKKTKSTPKNEVAKTPALQTPGPHTLLTPGTPLPTLDESPVVEVFQILKLNKRREKAPIVDTPFRAKTGATPKPPTVEQLQQLNLLPSSTPKSAQTTQIFTPSSVANDKKIPSSEAGDKLVQLATSGVNADSPAKVLTARKTPGSKPAAAKTPSTVGKATPTNAPVTRRRSLSMESYAKKLLGKESPAVAPKVQSQKSAKKTPKPTSKSTPKLKPPTAQQVKQLLTDAPIATILEKAAVAPIEVKTPVISSVQLQWEASLQRLTSVTKAETTWVVSIPKLNLSEGESFMREAIKTGFCWPRNILPTGEHSWRLYDAATSLGQNAFSFFGSKRTVPIDAVTYDVRPFERQMYYQQVLFGKAQDNSGLHFCCVLIRPMAIMLVVTSKHSSLLVNGLLEYIEQTLRQKL